MSRLGFIQSPLIAETIFFQKVPNQLTWWYSLFQSPCCMYWSGWYRRSEIRAVLGDCIESSIAASLERQQEVRHSAETNHPSCILSCLVLTHTPRWVWASCKNTYTACGKGGCSRRVIVCVCLMLEGMKMLASSKVPHFFALVHLIQEIGEVLWRVILSEIFIHLQSHCSHCLVPQISSFIDQPYLPPYSPNSPQQLH